MSQLLQKLLAERRWLLADGATGTNLFGMGLETGDAPELWNLDYPERVATHYHSFVDAGADIVLTNSFGGTRYRLQLHGAEARVNEINREAARICRECVETAGRPVIVAGSIGPTGEILEPLGALSSERAAAAFAEQARGLAEGGADVLWIETMSSLEELTAAMRGAATVGLPLVCTMSFDTNGKTMMGISPQDALLAARATEHPPIACGANCGVGAADLVASLLQMKQVAQSGDVLVAKANCGIPKYIDGEIVYDGTPELMAAYARLALDAGARIIGGCCGTTPQHLTTIREALESHTPGSMPSLADIESNLGKVSMAQAQATPRKRRRRRT